MPSPQTLCPGDVYWLDGCPPLDGEISERRPVVIIDDAEALQKGADPVIVVGVTTSDCQDPDRVDLPNELEAPGTTSGLPRPCCALPRWTIQVDRSRLRERAGSLPKVTLEQLVSAVESWLDSFGASEPAE